MSAPKVYRHLIISKIAFLEQLHLNMLNVSPLCNGIELLCSLVMSTTSGLRIKQWIEVEFGALEQKYNRLWNLLNKQHIYWRNMFFLSFMLVSFITAYQPLLSYLMPNQSFFFSSPEHQNRSVTHDCLSVSDWSSNSLPTTQWLPFEILGLNSAENGAEKLSSTFKSEFYH